MDKLKRYSDLVTKFKAHKFKNPDELINPHSIPGFEFDVINPWELWHNNLDAEIMFIEQDFSDSASLKENLSNDWKKEKNSPTNLKIIDFFNILDYHFQEVDYSQNNNKHKLFFTNAILGIKQSATANMSKSVKNDWYKETSDYLRQLIDIIQPKYIIVMGKIAYLTLSSIYNIKPKAKISEVIGEPIKLSDGKVLFVVQHCSPLGLGTRLINEQKSDWISIKRIINP